MPETQYRLFFDNQSVPARQMEAIDEIVVEQEVDMAWEARLKIPFILDAQGNWQVEEDDYMRPFCRVRIEVKIGDQPYVAIFDGSVTGFDSHMNSQPGQSTMTLIAQDDTFFLNRGEQVVSFENKQDHEVAEQLFNDFGDLIASRQVDNTPASGSALTPLVVRRGTAMQLLRYLAKRQGMHAYVLPGDNPGESIGCFKSYPTASDGLPALVLLGDERNIDELQVRYCACKPSDAAASTLRIKDKQIVSETVRRNQLELMGDETGEEESNLDLQVLPPRQGESVDLRQALTAVVEASGFSYDITGNVIEDTYPAVLSPYRVVAVRAGNTVISGDCLVVKTTHKINRGQYSQSFSLKRNARSSRFSAGQGSVPGGIF